MKYCYTDLKFRHQYALVLGHSVRSSTLKYFVTIISEMRYLEVFPAAPCW